jgi:ribose transport system permease protein
MSSDVHVMDGPADQLVPIGTGTDTRSRPAGARFLTGSRRYVGVAGALVLLIAVFGGTHSFFLSWANISNILDTNSVLMIVAVGMTVAMVGGGFDLSVGSYLVGTAVVLRALLVAGVPQLPAVILAVLACAVAGALLNGVLIGYGKLNFLVVTLGTMSIIQGLVYVVTNGNTESIAQYHGVTDLGSGSFIGVSYQEWFMIGAILSAGFILRFTRFGRSIYAIGGNREAARVAGLRVPWVTVCTYGLCSLFVGIAGVLDAGQLAAASPSEGTSLNLIAGAAVLLGGTSFSGGEGGVIGTVLGVLLIGALQNGLGVIGVSDFWQGVVTGAVLIAAVGLDQLQRGRFKRKKTTSTTEPQPAVEATAAVPAL